MTNIVYGVCTNSWERVQRYVVPHVGDRPLVVLQNQMSITVAYNQILDVLHERVDMLVLLHDDLELVDPRAEEKLLAAVSEPDVAIVGVAGGRGVRGLAWWNHETVGWQQIDSGPLVFGERTGDVDSVEGSIMALSPWAIRNMRFDENFTGFHGYDEIGLAANRVGKRVVVADVDTHHHTRLGFSSPASEQAWFRADEMFRQKYEL
jgi:hypothetical protein